MTPEISEEELSQAHIAEEQQELENREESIKNVDLQDSLKHLSHYSESNGTNLRMTERQLYHLLRPGSQPLARDLRNVASELSGLAAITQKGKMRNPSKQNLQSLNRNNKNQKEPL